MNDDELLGALGDALEPPDRPVPAEGLAAVRAQAAAARSGPGPDVPVGDGASRRTVIVGSIAAALGAAAGIAGTVAATHGDDGDEQAGPPTRPVEFSSVPSGTTVAGRTIDHTWGMELLLDVSGLPVDRDYTVTYATDAGPVSAGGFRSVAVPMVCRFNGTALRAAVREIAIADQASGDVVLRGRPV
ncbi:MAG: hypothetical protein ACTHN0_14680 [Aquihabitans sp.]